MSRALRFLKLNGLYLALFASMANLAWFLCADADSPKPGEISSQQNSDFPETYISRIHLDLGNPNSLVTLTWTGPCAMNQDNGPFRSSPGAGWGTNDCNDVVESNCPDSNCTPKGTRKVEGFMDFLMDSPVHKYVTLIDKRRRIGFHSCPVVSRYPISQGCVRLEPYAARLIHDNSIVGVTEIVIDGTWTNPALRENSRAVAEQSGR